ncbi:unnamed protein product, partial [Mesorhabditis belari]|uniref:Uncharacterized protein n=1 Tax=Mesorhabditis belari TaxID=2138241 RepID=A0AAF3J232_9BILA
MLFAVGVWLQFLAIAVCEENVARLYNHLMEGYEREVRPSLQHDRPIDVSFVFSLTQIIDVDERNQILTTNAWVRQHWMDYQLVWDPRRFGNVTKIHIPYERIWKPDIILYNNADSQYTKSVMSTDVVVNFMGNVTYATAGIFKSSCPLDVRFYPFDHQNCTLKFASWAYDGTKIDIHLPTKIGDKNNYMISTEWELVEIWAEKNNIVYSCCPEPYPFVDVHISIDRRPMFYVFNLILPCVLISGIALLGFYMPSDSGEKVTLGITSLLSTTVFLMLVAEGMPPTAEALPLIGIYYGVTIFLVSLATAMTVFTLNVHHKGVHGHPVPRVVQFIAFRLLARMLFLRLEPYHSITQHVRFVYDREHPAESTFFARVNLPFLPKRENIPLLNSSAAISASPHPQRSRSPSNPSASARSSKKPPPFLFRNGACGVSFSDSLLITDQSLHLQPTPKTSHSSPIQKISTNEEMKAEEINEDLDPFEFEFLRVMQMVHATIERNEMRQAEKDRRDAAKLEWQQVSMVLDRFLLVVFVLGTASASFVILYQRQLGIFE